MGRDIERYRRRREATDRWGRAKAESRCCRYAAFCPPPPPVKGLLHFRSGVCGGSGACTDLSRLPACCCDLHNKVVGASEQLECNLCVCTAGEWGLRCPQRLPMQNSDVTVPLLASEIGLVDSRLNCGDRSLFPLKEIREGADSELNNSLKKKTKFSSRWRHTAFIRNSKYSETCIRRNRMGPKIFSTLDTFPHYTK
jgi:hypothetical protein